MKKTKIVVVTIFICSSLLPEMLQAAKITKRKIELEWEAQPDAANYEVEIYNAAGSELIKSYVVPDALFKTTLPIGNYQFRSRYSTKYGQQSPWSAMDALDVTVPAGAIKMEDTGTFHQVDLKTHRAPVSFSWEMIKGIKEYKIDVLGKNGNPLFSQKVSAAPLKVDLGEGEYRFVVTPIDEYGNKGEPSDPSPTILVTRAQLPPPEVVLSEKDNKVTWTTFPGSTLVGVLFHRRIFSTEWIAVEKYNAIKKSPWHPPSKLAPGEYQLVLRSQVENAEPSEVRSLFFKVKPSKDLLLQTNN